MNPARACSLLNAAARPMVWVLARRTVQASARCTLAKPNVRIEPPPDAGRTPCGKFSIATNGKFSVAIDTWRHTDVSSHAIAVLRRPEYRFQDVGFRPLAHGHCPSSSRATYRRSQSFAAI